MLVTGMLIHSCSSSHGTARAPLFPLVVFNLVICMDSPMLKLEFNIISWYSSYVIGNSVVSAVVLPF